MASAPVVTKPAKPGTRSVRTTELICVKTRYNFVRASRKLIVEWIWQKSYELELSREQFSLAVGILDFIVSSVKLKEPSGPPTLLGAASIAIATTLEVSKLYSL